METLESKWVAELIEKMHEAKDMHELNELYNKAEKVLFHVYETLFNRRLQDA